MESPSATSRLTRNEGKRDVQYLKVEQSHREKDSLVHVAHPKGVMVWVAFDWNRMYEPRFVKPGCKVNAEYYIRHVLTPFIKEYKKYCPQNEMFLQQDSAPAHTAKKTLQFLVSNHMNFVGPD